MKPSLLFVTDLHCVVEGRTYHEEDRYVSRELEASFDLVLCSPRSAHRFLAGFDLVLFRNTGPVIHFREDYAHFRAVAGAQSARVFNELTGRGDMQGKDYLVELTRAGYPVIPTIDDLSDRTRLPVCDRYVIKPRWGADSIGLEFLSAAELHETRLDDHIIQPALDLQHEVSFYFINDQFQYALYAPDRARRWELESYEPSADDIAFAQRFITWNTIRCGIQRVDAGRLRDGRLLLMELEDLNPFLSLDRLSEGERQAFVGKLADALYELVKQPAPPPVEASSS